MAAAGFVMRDILRRLFSDARPIDNLILIVDFLVFAVIVWAEIRIHQREKKQDRRVAEENERSVKRAAEWDKIIASLTLFMTTGLELQASAPGTLKEESGVLKLWMTKTNAWGNEVNEFLTTHSRRASAAFLLARDSPSADSTVFTPSGDIIYLASPILEHYQRLLTQLHNVRQIIEKPEAYF